MPIAHFFHEIGRPGWIILTILGFLFWWPVGLTVLFAGLWSGNMNCRGRWEHKMERMREKMDRMGSNFGGGSGGRWGGGWGSPPSSGNNAFDEYRADTLKRLEEEQKEFREFLSRLRFAKDKTEFDQFMAERRNQQTPAPQA